MVGAKGLFLSQPPGGRWCLLKVSCCSNGQLASCQPVNHSLSPSKGTSAAAAGNLPRPPPPPPPPSCCLPPPALHTSFPPGSPLSCSLQAGCYRLAGVIEVGGVFTMRRGSASFTAPIDSDSSSPLQSSSFSPTNRERKEGDVRRRRVSDTRVVCAPSPRRVGRKSRRRRRKEEEKQKGTKNMKHSNHGMQQKSDQLLLKCEL